MALIDCAECRHSISDKATACPNCGAPQVPVPAPSASASTPPVRSGPPAKPVPLLNEKKASAWSNLSRNTKLWILVLVGVFIIWALGQSGGGSSNPASPPADNAEAVGAWVVCQQFVEDRLTSPSTADYPAAYSDYTTQLSTKQFKVDAYVDSQNGFGAMVRTDFVCTVTYQGNDNWHLDSLDIG